MPNTGLVIVIEDEPVLRTLLEETLADIGFSPATFDNAASALAYLISIKGDCTQIIADQELSEGIRGSEFIRLANEQWPSTPSIFTGYLIDEQVMPPSTFYLHKPYTLAELETAIATVLR
jgi:DNA-binding response OmpR family regulator